MCGIIGYVGSRECRDLLLQGLKRLEYRGYDSAGLSLIQNGRVGSVHAVGNLRNLETAVAESNGHLDGSTGIGHTRWATHGRVTEANAHPLWDTSERFHIVLNGIVENWTELRDRLRAEGAEFTSDTDAEVVAHLIASHFEGDLVEAVRLAYNDLRGHYAFVAMAADEPDVLVGARKECPLVVGLGEGESFIASAIPAFMSETRDVQLVHDGEIVAVTPQGSRFIAPDGSPIERDVDHVDWDEEQAEKGGYETFMLKEIHEQADAVAETLAAMRLARERGAKVLAITNIQGSQATRDADGVLFTRAGLEIGVAATKTFVAQVAAMYLLALRIAELRGTLDRPRREELITD